MKHSQSYLLTVALWLTILILPCSLYGFKNEPDNFRGIKWGTNINNISDMILLKSVDKNTKIYKRKNDKMKIGDAKTEMIAYVSYKERFYVVEILFKGFQNFVRLRSTFLQLYGKDLGDAGKFSNVYFWSGKYITIVFDYSEIKKEGRITYSYEPIMKEAVKDQKEADKKGAGDL